MVSGTVQTQKQIQKQKTEKNKTKKSFIFLFFLSSYCRYLNKMVPFRNTAADTEVKQLSQIFVAAAG